MKVVSDVICEVRRRYIKYQWLQDGLNYTGNTPWDYLVIQLSLDLPRSDHLVSGWGKRK